MEKAEFVNFKDYLKGIVPMADKAFHLALDFLAIKEVKKGNYFVKEGAICNHIAFIDKGLFRIFYLKDGAEVNTCFCQENSITSSFESFINRTASEESIQAIENSTLVILSYVDLMRLYELSPIWQSLGRMLTEKECLRLSDRAGSLSFENAMEKYMYLLRQHPEIIRRVPVQYIASYLGVSRETLSRIRSKITKK